VFVTHPPDTVAQALALGGEGWCASDIARVLTVPRSTIKDWLAGHVPGTERAHSVRGPESLPAEYAYLLGLYLGDGCLSAHRRDVYRLRITLDARYPDIVKACAAAIREVMPRNSVGHVHRSCNCIEVYAYSKRWPLLFPQHGPGKKHERPIRLEDWQLALVERFPHLLLRGLIHSDGCRFTNTGRNWSAPRYSFSNRSADIRAIFCEACDLMGLRWTAAPRTVYVSRVADVARLDEVIGPKA
jgi:hypothetical protein